MNRIHKYEDYLNESFIFSKYVGIVYKIIKHIKSMNPNDVRIENESIYNNRNRVLKFTIFLEEIKI